MKNTSIFFMLCIAISACNPHAPKNAQPIAVPSKKMTCSISVKRHPLTVLPDYYLFAFSGGKGKCGIEFMTPENLDRIVDTENGAFISNAFCSRLFDRFRVFTARHAFRDCPPNPQMVIENPDVVSFPFEDAISGFEIADPVKDECVAIKGFRVFDGQVEWVEVTGALELGSLEDASEEDKKKVTWNSGSVWLVRTNDTLAHKNLVGLSGAPVFNAYEKVIGLFSGVYVITHGKHYHDGTYLRIEALRKDGNT